MTIPDLLALALALAPAAELPPEMTLPQWWGKAAHRLLLSVLQQDDLQEGSELRPFTTSTLRGRFPEHRLDLAGTYTLRLTTLNREISGRLLTAIGEKDSNSPEAQAPLAVESQVELDGIPFLVKAADWDANANPKIRQHLLP